MEHQRRRFQKKVRKDTSTNLRDSHPYLFQIPVKTEQAVNSQWWYLSPFLTFLELILNINDIGIGFSCCAGTQSKMV